MATCLYTANAIELIHMKYQSFTFIIGCPDVSELKFIDETILSSRPETSMVGFLFSLEKSTNRRELEVFELVVVFWSNLNFRSVISLTFVSRAL